VILLVKVAAIFATVAVMGWLLWKMLLVLFIKCTV